MKIGETSVAFVQPSSLPSWSRGFDSHHPLQYMCLQLSWIEQLPSKQWAGGSNPSRHANFFLEFKKSLVCVDNYRHHMVGIVQLVRASVCGTECRGFESHYPPHFNFNIQGYSQVGKAPDFDSGMRRFESCYPCQGHQLSRQST